MPKINFRWSFVIILCLVVATARALSMSLSPRPTQRLPFTKISSLEQVGKSIGLEILQAKNRIIGIGYSQLDSKTETIVNDALAALPSDTKVISGGFLKLHRPHEQVDLLKINELTQAIDHSATSSPIVLVLPSIFISHRMGKNWVIDYESSAGTKISTFILGEVALRIEDEEHLSPTCYTSQRQGAGLIYDLGCLILSVSRFAQTAKLDPAAIWMAIEEEMPNEILLSVYAPESLAHE